MNKMLRFLKFNRMTRRTCFDTHLVIGARRQIRIEGGVKYMSNPERVIWRELVLEKLRPGQDSAKQRDAWLVIGPPASGKSTASKLLAKKHKAEIIDSEEVESYFSSKTMSVNAIREEADMLSWMLAGKLVSDGFNVIIQMVGQDPRKVDEVKHLLKSKFSYRVHLVLVDEEPEVCAARVIRRFEETGRFVDPAYVLYDVARKPRYAFDVLRRQGGWDSYQALPSTPTTSKSRAFRAFGAALRIPAVVIQDFEELSPSARRRDFLPTVATYVWRYLRAIFDT